MTNATPTQALRDYVLLLAENDLLTLRGRHARVSRSTCARSASFAKHFRIRLRWPISRS